MGKVWKKSECRFYFRGMTLSLVALYRFLLSFILQRLPMTRDLSPSKDSDKVAFLWMSIIEKPLKLF